ncbi:hypothetical protein PMKS-003846 [Pichia membranifaciens]|uniref:PH domain-containing protein n=1 Tax=Pichia membranifaciens TaxID=4926 RepID=A0A1Q2YLB4_9ASCO|nr:hypothetical protein PMKS-003846 [Pichia membranifaciens]
MFATSSDENIPLMASHDAESARSSPFQSPSKSFNDLRSNLSSKDIFRIANQSVDEFLSEIESKNQASDISLPELQQIRTPPQSPSTQPLHVDKNILSSLEDNISGIAGSDYDEADDREDITPTDIVRDPSTLFVATRNNQLNGPKPPTQSPAKSPIKSPKKVTIDESPSRVHNYEVEKESDFDSNSDSDVSCSSFDKQNLHWSKVSIKPLDKDSQSLASKFAHLPSKPLPEITPSKSDYSIKSMPNMNYLELDSDDSDMTIAPSLATHISAPKRILSSSSSFNQFHYDHDHYMQDMKAGNLVEPSDIRSNITYSDKLKKDLVQSNATPLTQQLRNQLLEGFQDDAGLDRSGSVKSMMSISADDCKLYTKHPNAKLEKSDVPKHDEIVKLNKEQADLSGNENEENDTLSKINNPKNRGSDNTHKRTSSLSKFVENIIGSISGRGLDPDPVGDDELEQDVANLKKTSLRNISVQSVATTITESGFVSAEEGPDDNSNDTEELLLPNYGHKQEIEKASPDETIDTIVVTPTEEQHPGTSLPVAKPTKSNTSSNTTIEPHSNSPISQPEEQASILQEATAPSSNNTSFGSDDFILHVPFEDDILDAEFNEFNKSIQSRTTSGTGSSGSQSRVISIERAERNEMLDIWSKQRNYNMPFRRHKAFDSIHAPSKSYVVEADHPKAIKIINAAPEFRRFSDENSWIYRELEVLPNGVNKKLVKPQSINRTNSDFRRLHRDNSKASTLNTLKVIKHTVESDISTLANVKNTLDISVDADDLNNLSGASVIKHSESMRLVNPSDTNNFTALNLSMESNDDASRFSQIYDNSLLNDLKNWDPDYLSAEQSRDISTKFVNSHPARQDSIDILKQVWHDTNDQELVKLTHSDTFQRLNGKNIEDFLNKKRTVSDEYHVKQANVSKARVQNDHVVLPEQRASIYQYGNESYSKIVPELGIADIDSDGNYYYGYDNQNSLTRGDNSGFEFNLGGDDDDDDDTLQDGSDKHIIRDFNELEVDGLQDDDLRLRNSDLSYPLSNSLLTPPKSPVSPARQKMVEKFEKQLKQKKEQQAQKELLEKLQNKIHQEAQLVQAFSPAPPSKKAADLSSTKKRSYSVNEDSLDNIYENFDNSPTRISYVSPARAVGELSNSGSPERNANGEMSFNPFESPKIMSLVKTDSNIFNVPVKKLADDGNSANPFLDDESSSNFQKIPSVSQRAVPEPSKKVVNDKAQPLFNAQPKVQADAKALVNGEQGRLFIKLQDISGLRIPDLKKRNAKFQLVLDNGIHCIKTDFVDAGTQANIPLSKEFELIVADKLNIIITLKLKYDKPQPKTIEVAEKKKVKSKGMMGKLMGKKETKVVKKMVTQPAEEDALASYVASDGSFSKLKINFDEYKEQIFAKPSTYALTCFNEWKTTKTEMGVVKNFKPIPICTLNIKMMFIPRTTEHEILPISIANALAQLKQVRKLTDVKNEGYMSQEGGDLEIWTKRLYKLDNYDLLAYNISSNKLKAKINLKKVVEVSSPHTLSATNTRNQTAANGGDSKNVPAKKRDFSDIDGMILNSGFRIRFSNNETISFGCDTATERDRWIKCFEQLIMLNRFQKQPWLVSMAQAMKDFPVSSMVV